MRYEYNSLTIELEENEVYMLNDLLMYVLDYENEHKGKITEEKIDFARRLIDITREDK